jgi:hypothetical protein
VEVVSVEFGGAWLEEASVAHMIEVGPHTAAGFGEGSWIFVGDRRETLEEVGLHGIGFELQPLDTLVGDQEAQLEDIFAAAPAAAAAAARLEARGERYRIWTFDYFVLVAGIASEVRHIGLRAVLLLRVNWTAAKHCMADETAG